MSSYEVDECFTEEEVEDDEEPAPQDNLVLDQLKKLLLKKSLDSVLAPRSVLTIGVPNSDAPKASELKLATITVTSNIGR